jgi:hypothetical protein
MMRGTRYGDFSKLTFDPAGAYTGVLWQQGRVALDADLNDQGAIVAHAVRGALRDLVGGDWAPATSPGFGIRPQVALEFAGDERLLLDDSGALAPTGQDEHTLELWLTWYGGAAILVACAGAATGHAYEVAVEETGTLVLALARADTGSLVQLYSSAPLPQGQAVHLAVVIGADYAALMLGGKQVARGGHGGLPDIEGPVMVIGGPLSDASAELGFRGHLTAVRAWATARTLAQLAEGAPPPAGSVTGDSDPGLLAVWTFDQSAGGPLEDAAAGRTAQLRTGVGPAWRLVDLVIEPGRLYVDGVVCELADETLYTRQPGLASGTLPSSGRYLACLEVWEESVSAAEDPALREVALGGLDTSMRTRLTTRVRLIEVDDPNVDGGAASRPGSPAPGRMAAEHSGQLVPGNHLYRVEIHASGTLGSSPPPTFTWSRDNGASVFAVTATATPGEANLMYASSAVAPLAPGDTVEPLPAGPSLDSPAGPLLHVLSAPAASGQVTLDGPLPAGTALLRRWDEDRSRPRTATGGETAPFPVQEAWIELEDGIRIRFEGAEFRRGDYWWIVSRSDLGSIEPWPQTAGHPKAVAPAGVERLSAPLARLSLDGDGVEIEDLRHIIAPFAHPRSAPMRWEPMPALPQRSGEDAPAAPEAAREVDEEPAIEIEIADMEEISGEPVTADAEVDVEAVWTAGAPDDERVWATPSPPVTEPQEPAVEIDLARLEGLGSDPADVGGDEEPATGGDLDRLDVLDGDGVEETEAEPAPAPAAPADAPAASVAAAPGASPGASPVASPPRERGPERWSQIGHLDLSAGDLRAAVSFAERVVLGTDHGMYALSVVAGEAEEIAPLPHVRHGFQLLAIARMLLVVGGGPQEDHPDGRLFAWDTEANEWHERAPIPVRSGRPAMAIARGRLHVTGGHSHGLRDRVHGGHHIYEPEADRWSAAADLPTPRTGAVAATLGDRVHVVGGHGVNRLPHGHVAHESYDLEHRRWQTEPPLPEPRHVVASAAHRGRHVIALGGRAGLPTLHEHEPAERLVAFDPALQAWEWLPAPPDGLHRPILVSHGDRLLAFGARGHDGVEVHELA